MLREEKKPIVFLGNSLDELRSFPGVAIRESGYQLDKVQSGEDPDDWKAFPAVGKGTREIRVACADGAFRVFYVVDRPEAIYVLHAFRKTTQKTEKHDVDLATTRYKSLG